MNITIEPRAKDTAVFKDSPVWIKISQSSEKPEPIAWIGVIDCVKQLNPESIAKIIVHALKQQGLVNTTMAMSD